MAIEKSARVRLEALDAASSSRDCATSNSSAARAASSRI
jgi:hypothetical protein